MRPRRYGENPNQAALLHSLGCLSHSRAELERARVRGLARSSEDEQGRGHTRRLLESAETHFFARASKPRNRRVHIPRSEALAGLSFEAGALALLLQGVCGGASGMGGQARVKHASSQARRLENTSQ